MNYKTLSRWLKAAVLGTGGCVVFVYVICVPVVGQNIMLMEKGTYNYCYRPWLGLIWTTALPVVLGLWLVWKFAANIGNGYVFCTQNAHFLQWVGVLAAADGALFLAGNVLYLVLGLSHISVLLLSIMVVLATAVIAVTATVLAQLLQNTAALQKNT